MSPRLAVTPGDPAGIGPEVLAKALAHPEVQAAADWVIVGDPATVRAPLGRVSAEAGEAAYRWLERAAGMACAGEVDGIVTGPIAKEAFALAGHPTPGQTELLAAWAGAPRHAMMLVGGPLRVALATGHMPLAAVASTLTEARIVEVGRLVDAALRDGFGIPEPRLAVAGLNPHAGEAGLFGDEEERVVRPAVEALRRDGVEVEGPVPPDTVFLRAVRGAFDAVIALYHDQGLIPLKMVAFERAVNLTLGLPFVRTSPGHGTAFDLVGRGKADPGPCIEALRLAARLAGFREAGAEAGSAGGGVGGRGGGLPETV